MSRVPVTTTNARTTRAAGVASATALEEGRPSFRLQSTAPASTSSSASTTARIPPESVSVSGFMYSDDGGETFVDGGQLPSPGRYDASATTLFPQVFGDPEVKYLGGCTFVYSSILVQRMPDTASVAQTMGVHRSTDCGHTWRGPFEVTAATNPTSLLTMVPARQGVHGCRSGYGPADHDAGRISRAMESSRSCSAFSDDGGRDLAAADDSQRHRGTTSRTASRRCRALRQWQHASVCRLAPLPVPGDLFGVRQHDRLRALARQRRHAGARRSARRPSS